MSHRSVFTRTAVGTAGALLVLAAAYGLYIVRSILVLVLVALFIAISLDPVVRVLVRRGLRRTWAVTIVVLVTVVLVAGFIWAVVPPIVSEGSTLVTHLPQYLTTLSARFRVVADVTDRYHLTDKLTSAAAAIPAKVAGGAVGFLQSFLGALTSTLTVLVLSIYFMAGLPAMRRGLVRLMPVERRERAGHVIDVVTDKVGAYMIGNLVISLIAGAASFGCLELARVPFALPLAVIVALTDLIPMVGATLGAAVCVIVAALTAGIWPAAVIVLIFFIAYQQLENYLIAPRVLRGSVDLSAVVVFLVALLGGTILGLVGAVMAIPFAAVVKVLMSSSSSSSTATSNSPALPENVVPEA